MCGIAGIYNFRSQAPVLQTTLEHQTRVLTHRGPDAEGFYIDGPLGLGHRRLSILDLSDRGRQPMASPDGRYVLTYNGEIYNYLELRHELETKGYRFQTDTDTEVVLTLYAKEGRDCLSRLNGMYALAIWDSQDKQLFMARDRIGIKPLYYAETSDGFLFASEVKALFTSGQLTPQVEASHIHTYMAYGYVPGEECLFAGVKKLLPGHWLQVNPAGLRSAPYWDVEHSPNHQRSAAQTADELHALLLDAVQIHMRSDVPVGVFLSGGLDSSATVSLLAEAGRHDLKTFAVAYDAGPEYDESRYARLVSERFHTDHHVLYIDPSQFLAFIPEYVWHMDEPVTEAAALSLYFIAKLLREHVTVALSGEGADELFAGYDIYRYMGWLETYRRLPQRLRSSGLDPLFSLFGEKVRKYVRLAQHPLEQRYLGVSLPDAWYAEQLYSPDFRATLNGNIPSSVLAPYYAKTQDCDALTRMLYTDLKTWLVDDLLIKADKMTMANSVELRVPFLDHRVVEYAATIPSDMKLRGSQVKWILKKAMQGRLPQEILSRKKVGFPTPLALMLQTDTAGDYMRDLLLSSRSQQRAYFQPARIHTWIDQHIQKTADHHAILWQLIVLEEWHRQFIDSHPASAVAGAQHTA